MDKVTNNATASTDEGLRYRSNASQSKQQRPPPPKASMSMGYMPLLIDETFLTDDKTNDSKQPSEAPSLFATTTTSTKLTTTALALTSPSSLMTTTSATTAADTSRWVFITGYVTKSHYDQIRYRFTSLGDVAHTRGVCQEGRTNWIAIQYETRLEAEQALSLGTFLLVDGIWITVNRVTPQLLATLDASPPTGYNHSYSLFSTDMDTTANNGASGLDLVLLSQSSSQLDPARLDFSHGDASNNDHQLMSAKKKKWDDTDLYLNHSSTSNKMPSTCNTSVCQKIMNWIFGWNNL